MEAYLKNHVSELLGTQIKKVNPLTGGDISKSYGLYTESGRFFCKTHSGNNALAMFEAEKEGLKAIAATNTIGIPAVLGCAATNGTAFLVLGYIETKSPNSNNFAALGNALGLLHQNSSESFGYKNDNFIGSLPQSNKEHADWVSFYVKERLWPQLELAKANKLLGTSEIPSLEKMLAACRPLFEHVRPSLLHGDLWSGNYLIAADGTPYLIDPAVYYGHPQVDMAMTRLFGGFDPRFYSAYNEHFGVNPLEKEHNDIYQLYYLLVHLNLFGRSYYSSVKNILQRYFL